MRFLLSSGLLVSYLTIKKISSSARDGNYRKSVLRFPWYVLKHCDLLNDAVWSFDIGFLSSYDQRVWAISLNIINRSSTLVFYCSNCTLRGTTSTLLLRYYTTNFVLHMQVVLLRSPYLSSNARLCLCAAHIRVVVSLRRHRALLAAGLLREQGIPSFGG